MGNIGGIGDNVYQSPTEQFKSDILKLLTKTETSDMKQDKKAYINGVKHLYWKMIKFTPRTIRRVLKELEKQMEEEKKKVLQGNLTSEQKEKKILDVQYKYYDLICHQITKVLSFSPIVEEEIEGILDAGNTIEDVQKLGEIVRTEAKKDIMIMESERREEGYENNE